VSHEKPVCGYCKLDFEEHPVTQCLYVYEEVLDAHGKVVGYMMSAAPIKRHLELVH
jgi:hypothetical protein